MHLGKGKGSDRDGSGEDQSLSDNAFPLWNLSSVSMQCSSPLCDAQGLLCKGILCAGHSLRFVCVFYLWIYKLHHINMSSCMYTFFKNKNQSLLKPMQYPRPEMLKTEDFSVVQNSLSAQSAQFFSMFL